MVLPEDVALRLVLAPLQIEVAEEGVTDVGADGTEFTVTARLPDPELQHSVLLFRALI